MSAAESSSNSHTLLLRLHQALTSCSSSIEAGDLKRSDKSLADLADFLKSVAAAISESEDDEASAAEDALMVLDDIYRYITSPSLDQAVVDALAFELPKAVALFSSVSQRCLVIAERIIARFIEICSPRDMLSILCEALDSPSKMSKVPSYYAPLLSGVAKVFVVIQRRQFEQVKVALPVIINVLKAVLSESDDEERDYEDLLKRSVDVASSIQSICAKLEGEINIELRALLSLYALQIMAFVSFGTTFKVPSQLSLVLQLTVFLRCCDLSYIGLITGFDVDRICTTLSGEDGDDIMSFFSHIKHGASLAVIWGYKSNEVAEAFDEDLRVVKAELSSNQRFRWQALGMLRNIFTCVNVSWELKKHAIDFLLDIVDGKPSPECNNEIMECSSYMPSLFSALQAVEMVIMYAPDALIKKNAFDAFKKVLSDIPTSLRFDTLMALIKSSDSSSMIAILIDCVRNEMRMESGQHISMEKQVIGADNNACQSMTFWNAGILELMELVLRPARGGPPSLPEFGDAVLSALNLYRFVLMIESKGNTDRTGVRSKTNLQKAYSEWLLPLRTLVTGILAENLKDSDELSIDIVCGLNPIELVLYRCIELLEQELPKTA